MSEQCEEYPFRGVDTYHLIVDLAEEGIWILNADDVLVFTNKKLQSMLGYSKEEMSYAKAYMTSSPTSIMRPLKRPWNAGTGEFERRTR